MFIQTAFRFPTLQVDRQFFTPPTVQTTPAPAFTQNSDGSEFDFVKMRNLALNRIALPTVPQCQLGLDCRQWGLDQPETNPRTGTECWSGNAWDWARGALDANGADTSDLAVKNSRQAYRRLEKSGDLNFGNPPPGALVFAPKSNGGYRLGFANPDGDTFRTTVPQSRSHRGVGDRNLPQDVAWTMPAKEKKAKPTHDGKKIDPRKIHMTQTRDARYNPNGDSTSSDCVPTSFAMGLKAIGHGLKGNPRKQIDAARYKMEHGVNNDRDGVDSRGRRSSAEHHIGTSSVDVERAARRLGVKTGRAHSVADAQRAVQNGHPVVLFGSNGSNIWGDKHGLYHFNDKHAVLLSGYNEKTGMFTINDPLSHGGPIKISRRDLARFHNPGDSLQGVILKG